MPGLLKAEQTPAQKPKFISPGIRTNSEKTLQWVIERGKHTTVPLSRKLPASRKKLSSHPAEDKTSSTESAWNDFQRRSFKNLMGDHPKRRVDATHFMASLPSNANWSPQKSTFNPRKPRPALLTARDIISRQTYSVASSASVDLTHSSEVSSSESNEPSSPRQQVLTNSNSRVNALRGLIKEEYEKLGGTGKEVTINLVVRPGSSNQPGGRSSSRQAPPPARAEPSPKGGTKEEGPASSFRNLKTPVMDDVRLPEDDILDERKVPMKNPLQPFEKGSFMHLPRVDEPPPREWPPYSPALRNQPKVAPSGARSNHHPKTETAYVRRMQTPDHLKPLSAKHFFQQKYAKVPKVTSPPDGQNHLRDQEKRTVSTLTGELQYLIRNPDKRLYGRALSHASSQSSSSHNGRSKLPKIHPGTQRVMDSTAQTDFDYEEDVESVSVCNDKQIQTNPKDAEPQSKEIGIQMDAEDLDQSREVSVQVDSDDFIRNKEIDTQVDGTDLVPIKDSCTQYSEADFPSMPVTIATQTDPECMDSPPQVPPAPQKPPAPQEPPAPQKPPAPQQVQNGSVILQEITEGNLNHNNSNEAPSSDPLAQTNDSKTTAPQEDRLELIQPQPIPPPNPPINPSEEMYPWDTVSCYEQYYLFLRTEEGAILGPLQLDIDETEYGLPGAVPMEPTSPTGPGEGGKRINIHDDSNLSLLDLNHLSPQDHWMVTYSIQWPTILCYLWFHVTT